MKNTLFTYAFVLILGQVFCPYTSPAQTTVSYYYTGSGQSWTVPSGVTSINVDVQGATGGGTSEPYSGSSSIGGYGGRMQATIAVTPGQVLDIYVGGAGTYGLSGGSGGYNGGGNGQSGLGNEYDGCEECVYYYGGGGGGASDLFIGGNLVVIAGGGGGGAISCYSTTDADDGGNGGGTDGADGGGGCGGGYGTGGTSSGGGYGGACSCYGDAGSYGGYLYGGDGGPGSCGAGGGGGYFGGGGGQWGGAGGGSSYADPSITSSVSNEQGYNSSGDGVVNITYTVTCPTTEYVYSTWNLCPGVTSNTFSYDALPGTTTCSLTWDATGLTDGFTNIVDDPSNPFDYAVPTTAVPGTSYPVEIEISSDVCGNYSGTLDLTIYPQPDVYAISNQTLCSGGSSAEVDFDGDVTGTTFSWTNDNTSIGLGGSGTGASIAPFTATNTATTATTGNITVTPSANGCTGTPGTFSITVNPEPDVASVSDQVKCNGTASDPISFTGSITGTTFSWTNDNTSIGLAGSGAGSSIASFSLVNTGTTPQVANISVTPSANGCDGIPENFTITVNPTPGMAPIDDIAACVGATIEPDFTETVSGTTFTWTNTNTAIGLTASGTGDISFDGTNSGTTNLTGTISVTPTANGCTGSPTNFTITVFPAPNVHSIDDQEICNGVSTTAITFSGDVTGTTYSWTNDNTTIGAIGSSGSGTGIAAFTGTNTGGAPQVATISVTPSANGCEGEAEEFTITVDPIPTVATIDNQSLCTGVTGEVAFSGTITGTTYSWTNNNTDIGLDEDGTDNISFETTNTETSNETGTITVTPSIGTCDGTPVVFTITVFPVPDVTGLDDASQSLCGGEMTDEVTFDGDVTGTTYTWTNSNSSIGLASSGSTDAIASFRAINSGTSDQVATITVTPTANGCSGDAAEFTYTVAPSNPGTITGPSTVCSGTSATMTDAVSGGDWTSSNTSAATISDGVVSGVASGVTIISYTVENSCGDDVSAVKTVSVTVSPAAISGTGGLCTGASITLSDATGGGTWTSGSTGVATVAGGIVNGVTAGTATISYSISNQCMSTKVVTVSTSPSLPSGPAIQCTGIQTQFTDATSGGAWTSGNTAAAIVGSGGIVTGETASGVANISYTVAGCSSIKSVTVFANPNTVTGTGSACSGSSVTLSDATSGGSWTSGNTLVATVGTNGIVTGVSAGTAVISYSLTSGCASSKIVTVTPGPSPISGPAVQCTGQSTQFTDATPGGLWSSSNTSAANVGTSGIVTGASSTGMATINYSLSGCTSSLAVTVNASPAAVTGTGIFCSGIASSLADATTGGVWNSSNTVVAGVSTTGIVTGASAGTATISYSLASGCASTKIVTVNNSPSTISGPVVQCSGTSTQLTNSTSGGVWSSSNTSAAAVGASTGIVTGETAPSTANISYSLGGCYTYITVSVFATPAVVAGTGAICSGASATYTDATSGGTWSSTNTSVAGVSTSGVVSTLTAGTSIISYSVASGCASFKTLAVSAGPGTITGASTVCTSTTYAFTDGVSGGIWTSSNTSGAIVGSLSGIVTGEAATVASISYTLSGCSAFKTVTVVSSPAGVSGTNSICSGASTTFADVTSGGSWISSNASVATVGTGGIVTGSSAGTAVISYSLASGCTSFRSVTINPAPSAITGTAQQCTGQSTQFTDAVPGGTWISSNTSAATVGTSGLVTGMAATAATISYSISGCTATLPITIYTTPLPVTGAGSVCVGHVTSYTDATASGTWSSSNTAVASMSGSTMSGVMAGTAVISYSVASGCAAIKQITVNASPAAISGSNWICTGLAYTFTDGTPGGTWTSSNTSSASVGSLSGIVSGITGSSVALISYTVAGCTTTESVTVNTTPYAISGAASVNTGSSTTFTDASTGGTWTSSNTAAATVGSSSGIVFGVATGSSIITYALSSGCNSTRAIVVLPISGRESGGDADSVELAVSPQDAPGFADVKIIPNPNTGDFVVTGRLSQQNDAISMQVSDMFGQVVYEDISAVSDGSFQKAVKLNQSLPNGMYLLIIRIGQHSESLHFVLTR